MCWNMAGLLATEGSLSIWAANDMVDMGVLNSCVMLLIKSFFISVSFFCRNAVMMVNKKVTNRMNVKANEELKKLLENEKLKNEKVQAQYDELEVSYTNLKTATAISLNGSDVKETKLRLSKLVREVDKCIALLNE